MIIYVCKKFIFVFTSPQMTQIFTNQFVKFVRFVGDYFFNVNSIDKGSRTVGCHKLLVNN